VPASELDRIRDNQVETVEVRGWPKEQPPRDAEAKAPDEVWLWVSPSGYAHEFPPVHIGEEGTVHAPYLGYNLVRYVKAPRLERQEGAGRHAPTSMDEPGVATSGAAPSCGSDERLSDEEEGCCEICHAHMDVEFGDDPTDICHSCAYAELDDVRDRERKLEAELEAYRIREELGVMELEVKGEVASLRAKLATAEQNSAMWEASSHGWSHQCDGLRDTVEELRAKLAKEERKADFAVETTTARAEAAEQECRALRAEKEGRLR
jgi:hypothetical protein